MKNLILSFVWLAIYDRMKSKNSTFANDYPNAKWEMNSKEKVYEIYVVVEERKFKISISEII